MRSWQGSLLQHGLLPSAPSTSAGMLPCSDCTLKDNNRCLNSKNVWRHLCSVVRFMPIHAYAPFAIHAYVLFLMHAHLCHAHAK